MHVRWILVALVGGLGLAWHESSPVIGYITLLGCLVLFALRKIDDGLGRLERTFRENHTELSRRLPRPMASARQETISAPDLPPLSDIFIRDPNWSNPHGSQRIAGAQPPPEVDSHTGIN
jgi:hypothetical protein